MRNIKITIEYDGTNYTGWQSQSSGTAIQDVIQKGLRIITNEDIKLGGASRTDSGVHALAQVANFKTTSSIDVHRIPQALSSVLPKDIVIKTAEEVDENFHARYSSKGKKYKYVIYNAEVNSVFDRNYSFFVKKKLNVELMNEACQYIVGTHNFSSFRSIKSTKKSDIRTIFDAHFEIENNKVIFYIDGDGFLYNMVRIIVSTLLNVGLCKIKPQDIVDIMEAKDRKKAGKTLSPQGLFLCEVYY